MNWRSATDDSGDSGDNTPSPRVSSGALPGPSSSSETSTARPRRGIHSLGRIGDSLSEIAQGKQRRRGMRLHCAGG
jgi:hypothetical protein